MRTSPQPGETPAEVAKLTETAAEAALAVNAVD